MQYLITFKSFSQGYRLYISYLCSAVTMFLSCTVSEISLFSFFENCGHFKLPLYPSLQTRLQLDGEHGVITLNRFDTVHLCDRQTDRHTVRQNFSSFATRCKNMTKHGTLQTSGGT